jgi:DNA processing protein
MAPYAIYGNWRAGWALDLHTMSSQLLPDGSFENTRTEIGEMLYKLKYTGDKSMIEPNHERYFWYRLMSKSGVGPRKLVSAAYRLSANPFDATGGIDVHDYFMNLYCTLLSEFRIGFEKNEYNDDALGEFERIARSSEQCIDFLYPGAEHYPDGLLHLADTLSFSPMFYTMGNPALLESVGVGVSGSRDASPEALESASRLAYELANNGINIVSGFAKGVDTAAHSGALNADGTTTVVVPFGLVSDYMRNIPEKFAHTYDVLFVSLFSLSARFSPANAFTRNRLICALSRAIVVVESGAETDDSGRKSGTFDTARQAIKARIPVFVLTPSIFMHEPQGNIELLRLGAREFDIRKGVDDIVQVVNSHEDNPLNEDDSRVASQISLF